MIFWELLKVFTVSLIGALALILIAGVIKETTQRGLSPAQLMRVLPLLIPTLLPYTIPATTLFASALVYGRLANDNEAVAIKSAGVDLLIVIRPAIMLGLLTMLLTGLMYYSAIPKTQQMIQEEALRVPEEVLYNILRSERQLNQPSFPYVIFVKDVQGKRLIDVIVKKKSEVRKDAYGPRFDYDFVARAREAKLVVDMEKNMLRIESDHWVTASKETRSIIRDGQPPEVELPDMFSSTKVKAKAISLEWTEIDDRIRELQVERNELVERREKMLAAEAKDTNPMMKPVYQQETETFKAQIKATEKEVRNVAFEYYNRPALAFQCFCFALIGCPVGLWANRSDYLSTFILCFLPTVIVYYPLMFAGGILAKDGKLPMLPGVWFANLVIIIAIVILTWRLIKR